MPEPQTPPPLEVSVLIVSYNSAIALRRCLTALEASPDRERFEIIVVDNGSRDDTPEVQPEFPRVTFLRLPRNFGYAKAMNIAMRTAKTELFFFLDPEVEIQAETVTALAARLAAEPDAVAVCPLLVSESGDPAPQIAALPNSGTLSKLSGAGTFDWRPAPLDAGDRVPCDLASLSALLARGYFLKGLRYIDERFAQSWADAEVCVQIRRAGRKIYVFPAVRAVLRPDDEVRASMPASARALLDADWALGAAEYAGKHFGFLAGLRIRILATLASLAGIFGSGGFSRFMYILSGQKINGTQTAL